MKVATAFGSERIFKINFEWKGLKWSTERVRDFSNVFNRHLKFIGKTSSVPIAFASLIN